MIIVSVCSCTVPGPVFGLSATPGVVQLTFSWIAPSEPNGVITMYQVTHNSTGVLNYTNTSATQLTLRDLPPNTAVEYSVRAYTIIGPGEAVSGIASTKDIRECAYMHKSFVVYNCMFIHAALINSVSVEYFNCSAVRITWTPLNDLAVDHHTVHYTNAVCGNMLLQTFPASASSGVVSGLLERQQYQFSVSVSLSVSGQVFHSLSGSMQTVTGE